MGGESEDEGTVQEATEQRGRAVMGQGREGGWAGGRREMGNMRWMREVHF